jgi:hypothetical protein
MDDHTNSSRVWRRHPILTSVLLLLALAATVAAAAKVPRSYQAEGSAVLIASRAVAKTTGDNPYLSFSPSLSLTAEVVIGEMMAPSTAAGLASRGFADPYTVTLASYTTSTTGSTMTVTVNGSDRAGVALELAEIMGEVQAKLAGLQSGMKSYNRVRAVTIAQSQQPSLSVSSTARPVVLVAVGGLLAALGLPWVVDAQLARRRARRVEAEPETGADQAADDEDWTEGETEYGTRVYRQSGGR